ncbi:MAG: hypothetical protein QME62_10590 [Armatimonadota bacterium]|nr:hypothetical protein [Armatimonadota bacterium]
MRVMHKLRATKNLAWLLIILLSIPYLASGALAAGKSEVYTQTVVTFPLDVVNNEHLKVAEELRAFVNRGLESNPKYIVLPFSDRLPAIQRLVVSQPEKKLSFEGPFFSDQASVTRALDLAKLLSADIAVVGSLDECVWDAAKGQARVTATLEWYDLKTGKKLDTLTATGIKTKSAEDTTATQKSITADAVKELGEKLVAGITGQEYRAGLTSKPPAVAKANGKSKKNSWLPMLLLSLGVGLLLGSGGGGGGGSSNGGVDELPPPPPF